jgi:beta-lactamase superfamily II metal-dependent hydrolase
MPALALDDTKSLRGARARIRMYRVGLGDCFLLSVKDGEVIRHMLIDCGMFAGSRLNPDTKERDLQREIVSHIGAETGKQLDVLVITHEHMDHLSIFNSSRELFEEFRVGETWFGWMEEDTPANQKLREKYEVMEAHLAAALTTFSQLSETDKIAYSGIYQGVASIAGFLGFDERGNQAGIEEHAGAAGGARGDLGAAKPVKKQPRAAMDFVKGKTRKHRYGSPGDIWNFGSLKVYVLGPPPLEKQLRILERAGATYDTALGALATSSGGAGSGSRPPFGDQWQQPVRGTGAKLDLDESVVEESVWKMLDRYLDPRDSWRRIDLQALDSTPSLALQIDNYINNTSLALAFEFPGRDAQNGDVLLFPGDAQVGNWEWWFKIEEFDVTRLLERTIFYKVGHHGSHNATLARALNLMTHPRLVAMMPTNQTFAKKSKGWEMPAKKLRIELLKHAGKRVLRNDQGRPGADDPMTEGEWGDLRNNVFVDELFIDYYV